MPLPKVGNQLTAAHGIGVVTTICHKKAAAGGLGFIFRNQPDIDGGVDGLLEIVSEQGEFTGRIVALQVKTGESFVDGDEGKPISVQVKNSTLEYWRAYVVPVILVVVDPMTDVAYWTRVDTLDRPIEGATTIVFVPRGNRFDSRAREQIRGIAAERQATLAEVLDPPALFEVREEVARCTREVEATPTPESLRHLAEASLRLAHGLHQIGKRRQAIQAASRAANALREGGAQGEALRIIAFGMRAALADLADPEFALSVWRIATLRRRSFGGEPPHWTFDPDLALGAEVFGLLLESHALLGDNEAVEAMQRASGNHPMATLATSWAKALRKPWAQYLVRYAEALAAIRLGHWRVASEALVRARDCAPAALRARTSIQAGVAAALGGRPEDARELFARAGLPQDTVAMAGLAICDLIGGNEEAGVRKFDELRLKGITEGSPASALLALSALQTHGERFPEMMMHNLRIFSTMGGIREAFKKEAGERLTTTQLLHRAREALAGGHLSTAFARAGEATIRAALLGDLGSLYEATECESLCWCGASCERPGDIALARDAAVRVVRARGSIWKNSDGEIVSRWVKMVVETFPEAVIVRLLDDLASQGKGLRWCQGVLRLCTAILDHGGPPPTHGVQSELLDQAVKAGWDAGASGNPMGEAGEFIAALDRRGEGVELTAESLNALLGRVAESPQRFRRDAVSAGAVAAFWNRGKLEDADKVAEVASIVANDAGGGHERLLLVGAASQAPGLKGEEIRKELERASQSGDLFALDVLLAAQHKVGADVLSAHATRLADNLERQLNATPSGSFSLGRLIPRRVVEAIAEGAGVEARERLASVAVRFVLEGPQLNVERATWLPVVAILGCGLDDKSRAAAFRCLLAVAEVGVVDHPDVPQLSSHPLSAVRADLSSEENERAAALSWLKRFASWLCTPAAVPVWPELERVLVLGLEANWPSVRVEAARAARTIRAPEAEGFAPPAKLAAAVIVARRDRNDAVRLAFVQEDAL